jgi:hypothetical protein
MKYEGVAWDEITGTFILLKTAKDVEDCIDAEYPCVRQNKDT